MKHEQRTIETSFNSKENKLCGYAAIFDTPALVNQYNRQFEEVIRKGAFSRSIKESKDIICCLNHDTNYLLGRTSSGTMQLNEDSKGLYFEVSLSENIESHREIKELAIRGDLSGASFTFDVAPNGEKWSRSKSSREIVDCNVYELGPVVLPVYNNTSVQMRSQNLFKYKLILREKN